MYHIYHFNYLDVVMSLFYSRIKRYIEALTIIIIIINLIW